MAIIIKNKQLLRFARELAKETGETIAEAIHNALQERLQRVRGRRHAKKLPLDVADILQRMDSLPTVDDRPENEILGYADYHQESNHAEKAKTPCILGEISRCDHATSLIGVSKDGG